jgi:hypothetical protein
MSNAPESVPFVRWVLQISQTDERWFLLARHATVVDRGMPIVAFLRGFVKVIFSPFFKFSLFILSAPIRRDV